jgi:hypothetical protein
MPRPGIFWKPSEILRICIDAGPLLLADSDRASARPLAVVALLGWFCVFGARRQPCRRECQVGAMDELAYFHQMDAATLIHGALFMMLWVSGIVAIDYWVGPRRF